MKVILDKPYPEVMVEEKNEYYADLLSYDYAGIEGEITAIMLYSYQGFDKFKEYPSLAEILSKIAKVEMKHMELLGKTIRLLGKNPIYKTCESRTYDCVFWNSKNVNYTVNIKDMLLFDIKSELSAIKTYKEHKKEIKDKYIKELIDRILLDEYRHLDIFNELYEKIIKK